ncbi:MAG: ROK family protein, partial [Planctomycetes bacterium]|nr:ROK family protein [Planctomycetota bacterium]
RVAHHVVAHVAHVRAGPAWIRCACGRRGCAQATLSAGGLVARARRAGCGRTIATARDVFRRAGEGDARCARALRAYARDLGRFAGELSNLFAPDAIVFAGGLSAAWPEIARTARASLARTAIAPVPRLLPARLGLRAGALGAAAASFRLPWNERLARLR